MERRVSVLLIEDDPEFTMLMNLYVNEACGDSMRYVMESAVSVQAGLDLMARGDFDIVLTDLNLPDSRGLQTLDRIRSKAPNLPVVVMTNLDQDELGVEAIVRGAQDFIPKGRVDAKRLRHALGFALARNRLFQQFETLIEGSPDGTVIVDRDRVVRYANAAACGLLGRSREELVGRLFEHQFSPGKPSELLVARKDEPPVNAEMRVAEIEWKGSPVWLATIRDVSELKKLEQARAEIRERRRMDEMKDQLLSTVAHELRTPIAIVKAVVGTLRDGLAGPLNEEQAGLIGSADRHINRLTRLLNNFLDLSRLESRRARVNLGPVDPRALVEETAEGLRMANRERGVEIQVLLPGDLPAVEADEDMAAQVLANLTDNAMRYARSRVTIAAVDTVDSVQFTVSDDGPGLPPGGAERLFDKFVQLDRAKGGAGYKGTGLGLAISREIVALNGGRIWAESVPSSGARFHFTLPLRAPAAAAAAGGSHAGP